MKLFEYMIGAMSHDWPVEDVQEQLNIVGETGWELVSVETRQNLTFYYFRRKKEVAA